MSFFWTPLRGMRNVKWPVKLMDDEQENSNTVKTVYCNCDRAYFTVKKDQLVPFPGPFNSLENSGLARLKKKPATKRAFAEDIKWALAQIDIESNQINPIECQDKTNIESNQITPIECQDKTSIESNQITPIECQDKTSIESNQITPIECQDKTNIESNQINPIECQDKTNIESNQINRPTVECPDTTTTDCTTATDFVYNSNSDSDSNDSVILPIYGSALSETVFKISRQQSQSIDKLEHDSEISTQSTSTEGNESDTNSENDTVSYRGTHKVYFKDYEKCFFMKMRRNVLAKSGRIKKSPRVHNSKHGCLFCKKTFAKLHEHYACKHKQESEVQALLECTEPAEKRRKLALLRNKADHQRNLLVKSNNEGEIILARRPNEKQASRLEDYAPCPSCFAWVSNLPKHRVYSDRCLLKEDKLSKRQVMYAAEKIKNPANQTIQPSDMLEAEVLSKMSVTDEITTTIKSDPLLLELGNCTIKKNLRNALRRGSYASSKMRLCARVLVKMRKDEPSILFDNVLVPKRFKDVVKVVTEVSGGSDATFQHPSNALKLGYHLKELSDIKETEALMSGDKQRADDARIFRTLCEKNWAKELSSLACATLSERRYNNSAQLPLPNDLYKLSTHLQDKAKHISCISGHLEYKYAVEVTQTRLLTYNKRRPGELESLSVENFESRNKEERHMEQYIHQLSQFERKLVENHDLVTVRGKRGRPVPVLIPRDIAPVMALLCSKDVRVAVGVEQSPFLFASINNPTQTVVRAGESLVRIVNSITLECPEAIRSTNLRKYMATTIQVMSLNASQMEWVADHLGHSLNVERTYYRMMSSAIEKAKIAKLLILADSGCITQYHGKRLDELEFDDIPVLAETDTAEDACIVAKHVPFDAESEDVPVAATKRKVSHDPAAAAIQVDTAEDHINVEQNQVDADSEDVSMAAKKGKVSRGTAKWSAEKSKHLHEQFSSHISNYIVPGKTECLLFLKRYKHKLYWKRVKDKVNSEIQKQRRRDK